MGIHGALYCPYQFKSGPKEILGSHLQTVSNQVHLHPNQQLLDFGESVRTGLSGNLNRLCTFFFFGIRALALAHPLLKFLCRC